MTRILIVEDESDLQQILRFNLEQAGFVTSVCSTGNEGIRLARETPVNLVLLDVMLPDVLGTEVCRVLKSNPQTASVPVIMLTAKGEESDRVEGFECGADDYVTKPFSVRELLLRVNAVLRRVVAHKADEGMTTFGMLRFDKGAHRAWVKDQETELSALEFKLLVALIEQRNRVLSRTVLLEKVWGVTADVTTRTVDTHVKRLREKLGPARHYIETVRGVGYRFVDSPGEVKGTGT